MTIRCLLANQLRATAEWLCPLPPPAPGPQLKGFRLMFKIPVGTTQQPVSADVLYGDGLPLPDGSTVEVVNDFPEVATLNNGRLDGNTFRAEAVFEAAEIIDGTADVASGHVRVTTPDGKESILGYQVTMTGDPQISIGSLKIGDFVEA